MGIELLVGPEDAETEAYGLGSAGDIRGFNEWVATLPDEGFGRLKAFARDGRTDAADDFADELAAAYRAHPPSPEVGAIVEEVGETCRDLPAGTLVRLGV